MNHWQATLRFGILIAVAVFIALATSVYEVDRREKSSIDTLTANLADLEQRVQILTDHVRIISNQYAANERRFQVLTNRIEALSHQYDARLKEMDDALRGRR